MVVSGIRYLEQAGRSRLALTAVPSQGLPRCLPGEAGSSLSLL